MLIVSAKTEMIANDDDLFIVILLEYRFYVLCGPHVNECHKGLSRKMIAPLVKKCT